MKVPESPTSAMSYLEENNGNRKKTSEASPESKPMNIDKFYESMCYANAVKASKNDKVGILVKRSNTWDSIYVSGIKENSKFADSKLKVGMVILTINGMKCPTTVKEIQKVMKECQGNLTIMAATISSDIDVTARSNSNSPVPSPAKEEAKAVSADDGPELIDDNDHPQNALEYRSAGPEIVDHKVRPDQPMNYKESSPNMGLEVTLTGHKQATTINDSSASSSVFSPGSSPMPIADRKVSASKREFSPVRVSTIDHTGGIIVTPKTSPEPSEEMAVPAMAARSAQRRNSTEEQDRTAKREARRSVRMSQVPDMTPGAYAVSDRPSTGKAAHSLSPAPRLAHADEDARRRALPPAAARATAQRIQGIRHRASAPAIRGLPPTALPPGALDSPLPPATAAQRMDGMNNQTPGAQRIPGIRHRGSAPSIPSLHPSALPPGALDSPLSTATGTAAQQMDGMRNQIPPPGLADATSATPGAQHGPSNLPTHASSAEASSKQYNPSYFRSVGVGVGVPVASAGTSVVSSVSCSTIGGADEEGHQTEDDYASRASGDLSEVPANSVASGDNGDALVVAAEVQEHEDVVANRIRQQILEETARADVVFVEHGGSGNTEMDESVRQEELKKHKPKNVREKLFGDGKKAKDVSMDIEVSPDAYIRKRDLLPWTVKQNTTNDLWVASVLTNQRAWEEDNLIEQERSKVIFSGKTEKEAKEAGLAMGAPLLQSFEDNPICFMCKSKFAVFNHRPHNCRNCGVVVCAKCSCIWSSKRLPSTYQTSKSTHSACLACDWSANNFQEALMKGQHSKAVKLYESGNINLRSPYISSKKKSGEEIM
jgi:hypothetical protein